ncbi:MAG: class I mannose-6-phosphate isomerase [Erysipelotrichaceae bacterium]
MCNYERNPKIKVSSRNEIISGFEDVFVELSSNDKLILECYPGIDLKKIDTELRRKFGNYEIINIEDYSLSVDKIQSKIIDKITDDRVFGFMDKSEIEEYYDIDKIEKLKNNLSKSAKYIVYGFGASMVKNETNTLVYSSITRWEIQLRYRQGMCNWKCDNTGEENTKKFKRGYFFDWRVADRLKKRVINSSCYFLDLTVNTKPKMISSELYFKGMQAAIHTPFRLVPFFDSGVWGGQWMKNRFNLDPDKENYAWSFDGVPEENSINLEFGNDYIQVPAIDLVFNKPKELLGNRVHARFGDEFPIRFDFLDTVDGQNLSLQVHPLTEYIQEKFGMNYTQDESYYILDTKENTDTHVYLGLKNNVNKEQFLNELKVSQEQPYTFDVEKYINKIPCKKHDHFLIPAGTVHCSGKDTMVLEISATPYIFTFKLFDWDRVNLDGKPRPIHLEHGAKVIDFNRDTDFVHGQLVNQFEQLSTVEERTGLHEREFIETRRFTSKESIVHKTDGSVNMLNLVQGSSVVISSPMNSFEDYVVHYAETFIVPANVSEYEIIPSKDEEVMYIKAYVR